MKKLMFLSVVMMAATSVSAQSTDNKPKEYPGYKLVFHDEFDQDGEPDPNYWTYDLGHRNNEEQLYTTKNAWCMNGNLVIEARKEEVQDKNGKIYHYTSSSVVTRAKTSGDYISAWTYGRFEVKAKLPAFLGCWPAIWLLSNENLEWPYSGEIDMMEYYRRQGVPHILANACWGTDKPWTAKWNSKAIPFTHFTDRDAQWADKFHVWRMDWDEQSIRLYLDDELLNEISQAEAVNGKLGNGEQPFKKPQYLLLNLALGGDNGGEIDDSALPMKYFIDYVRVYQKK